MVGLRKGLVTYRLVKLTNTFPRDVLCTDIPDSLSSVVLRGSYPTRKTEGRISLAVSLKMYKEASQLK